MITESNGRRMRRFNDAYRSVGGKVGIGVTDVRWADQLMVGAVVSDDYKEIRHGTTMEVVYGSCLILRLRKRARVRQAKS